MHDPTMITVHLHTVLQRRTPQGLERRLELALPSGISMAGLLARLEIDYPEALLVVVNGRRVEPAQVLQDGDEVHLVPPISGGAACSLKLAATSCGNTNYHDEPTSHANLDLLTA